MGSVVSHSVRAVCAKLTDVTLADEDKNSIQTDNANKMANFEINASGAIWWSYLQPMQGAKIGTNANFAIWWLYLQLREHYLYQIR